MLAEIERLQLEIEYDQLKHQLSPRYKKNSVSPGIIKKQEHRCQIHMFLLLERSTFQYDFPPSANKSSVAPSLPQSSKQNDCQQDVSLKVNEGKPMNKKKPNPSEKIPMQTFIIVLLDPNSDISQNRLLERKQQQWKQENCTPLINRKILLSELFSFSGKHANLESIWSSWWWRTQYQ